MAIIAPEVSPEPIPSVREQPVASPEAFGGGAGLQEQNQIVQKSAMEAGDIGAFERIRADQMAVEEAQAKGSDLQMKLLYDPKTGVLASRGTDALQAQKDGMQAFQKGMNDISSKLNGDAQIGSFNKWAQAQWRVVNQHMMTHVDEQLKDHDQKMFTSLLQNQAATVALGHGNPDALKLAFDTVNDNATAFAQRNRLDPDQSKQLIQDANDKMHTAVIDGMTKFQSDDSAQKYFDANRDKISPAAQEKIVTALSEHNIRWRAADAATKILGTNPTSESDALKSADGITNPEIQDAARKLISARFSENRAAVKNDQDALFMQMQQMVNQKGLSDPYDRRTAVPPMAWNKLSAEQQRAIEKGGEADVTSPRKWLELMDHVKDGTLTNMTQADLQSKFFPYLDAADQKKAAELWSGAKGGKHNQRLMDEMGVQRAIETNLVNERLIAPDSKHRTPDQNRIRFDVMDNVHREYEATQGALNRPLKPEEAQSIIDRATLTAIGKRPAGWFTSEPVPFESIPEQAKQSMFMLSRQHSFPLDKVKMEKAYQLHIQGRPDTEILRMLQRG